MNKGWICLLPLSIVVAIVIFIFQKQLVGNLVNNGKPSYQERIVLEDTRNDTIEDCEKKEIKNLKNNKDLRAEQLSVVFYTNPSVELINTLAEKYNLEVSQIYEDLNVYFKVDKERAPLVKCQLQNELEIKDVVFIKTVWLY